MKRLGYMMMVMIAAMAIAGCHCKDKCCGTCKSDKEAVKKACCGNCVEGETCCGKCEIEKKPEASAKPAPDKPKD